MTLKLSSRFNGAPSSTVLARPGLKEALASIYVRAGRVDAISCVPRGKSKGKRGKARAQVKGGSSKGKVVEPWTGNHSPLSFPFH
jgi:hypothetical protein